MVKDFFPPEAADNVRGSQRVAPTAAEAARNSRRLSVFMDFEFVSV